MSVSSGTVTLFGSVAIAVGFAFAAAYMLKHPDEVRVVREAAFKQFGIAQPHARPVAALQGLAAAPRVFYLGTFSKATYADIRFGYVVVPEALIDVFERAQRHMGMLTSVVMQEALAEFIGAGAYLGHIRRMTRLYKARRDRMLQALAAEAGNRLSAEAPTGGMQLLARCAPSTGDQELAARLLEAGVVSRPLSTMLYHRTSEQGLFLGFAAWNEKEIDRAARILGRIAG